MSHPSMSLAVTHDHWFEEPAIRHAGPALQLWWRHIQRYHPAMVETFEWAGAGTIAAALLLAQLIVADPVAY